MAIGRNKDKHLTSTRRIRHLRELIAALDGRTRHVERAGEGAIARDAASLRERALKHIEALECQGDSIKSRQDDLPDPSTLPTALSGSRS